MNWWAEVSFFCERSWSKKLEILVCVQRHLTENPGIISGQKGSILKNWSHTWHFNLYLVEIGPSVAELEPLPKVSASEKMFAFSILYIVTSGVSSIFCRFCCCRTLQLFKSMSMIQTWIGNAFSLANLNKIVIKLN